MKDVAAIEWSRACKTLAAAEQLLGIHPESAASRAYYAAFHAVGALFALRGRTFSKHSALRAALHRDLIRTGEWPEELGRAYDDLLESCDAADYETEVETSRELAEKAVESARRLIEFVRQSCPELTGASDTQ